MNSLTEKTWQISRFQSHSPHSLTWTKLQKGTVFVRSLQQPNVHRLILKFGREENRINVLDFCFERFFANFPFSFFLIPYMYSCIIIFRLSAMADSWSNLITFTSFFIKFALLSCLYDHQSRTFATFQFKLLTIFFQHKDLCRVR